MTATVTVEELDLVDSSLSSFSELVEKITHTIPV
jgi:hypothetical protein